MKYKAEHYKTCAETLNVSNGSDFWKARKFVDSYQRYNTNDMSYFKWQSSSNADKFEHLYVFLRQSSPQKYVWWILAEECRKQTHGKSTSGLCATTEHTDKRRRAWQRSEGIETSKKSYDPDGIHPLMLRHTGTFFKIACLMLFNLCLHAGTYNWNLGQVIFLRKPHKENYNIANTYRRITLTSYVGKLFERIIETIEKWLGGERADRWQPRRIQKAEMHW